MVLLKEYNTMDAAMIDKGLLESNGINCVVLESAQSTIFPAPGAGIGGIDLYVEDDKLKEARELIRS